MPLRNQAGCTVKHILFRAWLACLGLWWLLTAFNQFAFLHGERDIGFYLSFVLTPVATAVTMLFIALKGRPSD